MSAADFKGIMEACSAAIEKAVRERDIALDNLTEKQRLESKISELESDILALCSADAGVQGKYPVILYFETKDDKDRFVSDMEQHFPNLKSKQI